jgi:hypothetical protein
VPVLIRLIHDFTIRGIKFIDHVAIVRSYLDSYRNASPAERLKQSKLFSKYIVTACWRKMRRRIWSNWANLGLVYRLASIKPDTLRDAAADSGRRLDSDGDPELARLLQTVVKPQAKSAKPLLFLVMKYHPVPGSDPKSWDVLPALMSACNTAPHILYTGDTFIDFHHLLTATVIAYAVSLWLMRSKIPDLWESAAKTTYITGHLLSAIVHSRAFKCHVAFLCELLDPPRKSERRVYRNFITELIPKNKNNVPNGEELKEDEEDEGDEGDGGEFIRWHPKLSSASELSKLIRGRLKLFVNHMAAKTILEAHCRRLGPQAGEDDKHEISLIGVTPVPVVYPPWEKLKSTIKSVLSNGNQTNRLESTPAEGQDEQPSHDGLSSADNVSRREPLDSTRIIEYLDKCVKSTAGAKNLKVHGIFHVFNTIIQKDKDEDEDEKQTPVYYTVHCEATLAMFAYTGGGVNDNEDSELAEIRKVLFFGFLNRPVI